MRSAGVTTLKAAAKPFYNNALQILDAVQKDCA